MHRLNLRIMVIDDPAEAEFYLRHLNYYRHRLGAYWLPFDAAHASHALRGLDLNTLGADHRFRLGSATFEVRV